MAMFQRRLQSLPADEQRAFAIRQHPCQDRSFTGMVMARCCAQARWNEIRHHEVVQRVAMAADRYGFILEVVVKGDVRGLRLWEAQPVYRGYFVVVRSE
jgi:hypothetical protein